jgi:hypothetical protein
MGPQVRGRCWRMDATPTACCALLLRARCSWRLLVPIYHAGWMDDTLGETLSSPCCLPSPLHCLLLLWTYVALNVPTAIHAYQLLTRPPSS